MSLIPCLAATEAVVTEAPAFVVVVVVVFVFVIWAGEKRTLVWTHDCDAVISW